MSRNVGAGVLGDLTRLSFRALAERMRRRERNPEDVYLENTIAGNFSENACAMILRRERRVQVLGIHCR
jgi:hypothetical protein